MDVLYNCHKKKDRQSNNDTQSITQTTNDRECKLNVYKCWNICVDQCHLLATVYKVKIEKKIGSTWRLYRSTVGRRQSYKMPTNLHDFERPIKHLEN
jgi:endonuclease IV